MKSNRSVKSILETLMFTWGEPLDVKVAADVLNMPWKEVYDIFLELQGEYVQEGRGIEIRRVDKSFQFVTAIENAEYLELLCSPVKKKKLSQSALETLAIIAYRQPVTRGEIESIRGIKCDAVLDGLDKKNLIQEVGRSSSIGRPILYGTTNRFLKYFGFESIKDMPEIDDIAGEFDEFDELDDVDDRQITIDTLDKQVD